MVRGRFAPSPTGEMHLGNAWTALLAWLYTRKQGGAMVLRMEDIDPGRSRREYTELIMQDLKWLGLDWDEGPDLSGPYGPYRQSERRFLYEQALEKLAKRGLLYSCYCTRAELQSISLAPHAGEGECVYPGTCRYSTSGTAKGNAGWRSPALRLEVPDEVITFWDGVRGPYCQNLRQQCGDFVVRRSDGIHAYQLAVVVDDGQMHITQVVRGDDLLSSTPRQIALYKMLGLPLPEFVHVPLLYGPDGYRLSKRHGSLSLAKLRESGVQPENIVGFLAWKAGQMEHPESVKARELTGLFDLTKLPQQPVIISEFLTI